MRKLLILILLLPSLCFAQEVIHLNGDDALPTLNVFRPKKTNKKGIAIIICPGGAYAFRSDEGEGFTPAKKLAETGITAFVLDYRLPKGNDTVPLYDAKTAITYIRANAGTYKVDPHKVGIMGFSAGGHLAATLGTHFTTKENRPDFMVLAYPVISMTDSLTHTRSRSELMGDHPTAEKIIYYSNELQVTDDTPPTFIVHAIDDPAVPVKNSLYFEAALLQHHVPVQLFLYAHGGHAFGIHNTTAQVQWIDDCISWIKEMRWKEK